MSRYISSVARRPLKVTTESLPPPTSPHYHYHYMPTPRQGTYNICGYSAHTSGGAYTARRKTLLANMKAAMRHVDIFYVQETKLQSPEIRTHFKRDWYLFRNPTMTWTLNDATNTWSQKQRPAGGCDIYVRISFAHNFRLTHTVVYSGYVHYVTFQPLARIDATHPYFTASFAALNAYIPSDGEKTPVLARLRDHHIDSDYTLAAGDWNITTTQADSTTDRCSPQSTINSLADTLEAHGLGEVYHPSKTKISKHTIPHASRLDKHYITHNSAERKIMVPSIRLPPHPSEPGRDPQSPTDHFPVVLSFSPHDHESNGTFVIPVHIARLQSFADLVEERWNSTTPPANPCDELHQFDKLLTSTAKHILAHQRQVTEGHLEATTLALSVYKKLVDCPAKYEDWRQRCSLNTRLRAKTDGVRNAYELKVALEGFIDEATHSLPQNTSSYQKTRSTFSTTLHSYAPKTPTTGRDHHTNIRACVSTRSSLGFIIDGDGQHIRTPDGMARELKTSWEPIWKGSPATAATMRRYLKRYRKRINTKIPAVTIDDVIAEVARPKSTCPGPNGVPFLAYAVLCDIAAPILHRVITHLMQGLPPKHGFNWCTAFFKPKDSTHKARATRPIAASNTNNRIIANVIRRILEPHVLPVLNKRQVGFVRGRTIDECITYFNDKYYSALYTRYSSLYPGPDLKYSEGFHKDTKQEIWFSQDDNPDPLDPQDARDYHILFLDFAKAFDSVSRDYLLAVLHHIGIPRPYCHLIRALFHDVRAHPAVGGKTEVLISMLDGLKQGCPLSTLFFIIALDPPM